MESEPKFRNDRDAPPAPLASSFDPDIGIQSNGYDPFDPFSHGLTSSVFDSYEFKPFEGNGITGAAMQGFQGGEFLNFPNREDHHLLMEIDETALNFQNPKHLAFVVPDESSCVTADNIACHKGDNMRRSRISDPKNKNKYSHESESGLS
ncbi:hypothetical protein Salat_0057900 [Sesamum alatum]|uniref:Uncharacterized protein n=1 Tax=Sesamum alatum TaxID=300844 RepID=A0AAE2CWN3_9LAMI|nr:hypothetical protein Salat_0057900 [Sesamum alatum]